MGNQVHLFSPNAKTRTLTSKIPGSSTTQFCQVALNGDEFAVIGGNVYKYPKYVSLKNTRIINVKTDKLREGAQLNIPRHNHACGEIEIAGKSYIVATGGQQKIEDNKYYAFLPLNSTELLDKENECWLTSDAFDLPVPLEGMELVTSPDKKAIFAIGGWGRIQECNQTGKCYTGNLSRDIFKFECPGAIDTCKWKKISTSLRYARYNFVALPIPNALADKICY